MPHPWFAISCRTTALAVSLALGLSAVTFAEAPATQPSDSAEKPLLQGPEVEQQKSPVAQAMSSSEGFAEKKSKRAGDGKMLEAALAGIELSPEQREQLRETMGAIHAERRQWNKEHGESFKKLRVEMQAARKSGDRDAAKAAHEKIKALRDAQLTPKQIADKVRALLTDEQAAQFDNNTAAIREQLRRQAVEQARDKGAKARENMMDADAGSDKAKQPKANKARKAKGDKQLDL